MYTSYIGKKFLKIYRAKFNKPDDYSARQFFDEELFSMFFNDDKHFLNVANSSFFQTVSEKDLNKGKSIHQIKLERFHRNVQEDGASLTTMVGYSAQDVLAGTSGQVTSMTIEMDTEDMYSSWMGSGMSIAMGGGYSILIDNSEIIWGLFRGWEFYRKFLKQTSNLKGNQIDVWNSHWITHYLSNNYNDAFPLEGFVIPEPELCKMDKWKKLGYVEYSSKKWVKIIFALAQKYSNSTLIVNAFKFADTNQTLGFINIYLPEIRRLHELRDKLFVDKEELLLSDNEIEEFETFFYFRDACKFGTIGLKALEPAKLREFMPKDSVTYAQGKDFKFTDEGSYLFYKLYKLWIIAMLNKTELMQLASDVATSLINLEKGQTEREKSKTTQPQSSKELMDSKSIKGFVEGLERLLNTDNAAIFKDVYNQVVPMPADNFPLFITLIRFEYTYQSKK
jgi:hypothetical protein